MSPFHQVSHHYCISPVSHGLAPPVFTSISPLSISISPVSHRYLTSISRPGAASISPVSYRHQYYLTSHHYYHLTIAPIFRSISPLCLQQVGGAAQWRCGAAHWRCFQSSAPGVLFTPLVTALRHEYLTCAATRGFISPVSRSIPPLNY